MTIAIDFDGTCVTHAYPEIGYDLGATTILKTLVDNGHKLILLTMRSDATLEAAKKWFEDKNIPLYGINSNPSQKRWTNSPKVFANLYIDDANLGCPLLRNSKISPRPYVDWRLVLVDLIDKGCLLNEDAPKCLKDVLDAQTNLELFQ